MIGLRTGLRSGVRSGLAVGLAADELGGGVPFDGSTLIYRPSAESHFAEIGWPVPSWLYQLQELSGSITDSVHGVVATASGSGHTYDFQGTESTYSSKGIRLTDGVASAGFTSASTVMWDPTYHALSIYFEFEAMSAPAAARSVLAISGASVYASLNVASGQARIRMVGVSVNQGTYNYLDGKRHPCLVEWHPGTVTGGQILGHTSSLGRLSTDKEQFTVTWGGVGSGTKGIGTGGSASLTSADIALFCVMGFAGSSAQTIRNTTTPKGLLQAKGWTVTGY